MQQFKCQFYSIVDFDKCKGCQLCIKNCPINAIFYLPSIKKVTIIHAICLGCGRCQQACKFNAIKILPRL